MGTPETLDQLLERAAAFPEAGLRFLDRREREEWVSWRDIHARSRALAVALQDLGVEPGERVALVYPTGRDFFDAFFAVLAAGAVPVPMAPPMRLGRHDEYKRKTAVQLRAAGARLLLAERRLLAFVRPALDIANPGSLRWLGGRSINELSGSATKEPHPSSRDPGGLALVQFSSGTTLDPKPVALSHRALVAQARILNGFWPDAAEQRHSGVSWLPLYHDMGLVGGVLPALERPGVITLLAPEVFVARPALWLRALSRYRATISAAPSFAYRHAAEAIRDQDLDGVNLASWRVALVGAEPVAPGLLRRFQERFAPYGLRREALTPVYGLAEASLAVTFSDLDRGFETRRFDRDELSKGRARLLPGGLELPSLGHPVPGFTIRIADPSGQPLGPNHVGRLYVHGPSLMTGYLGQPAATKEVFRDGWLDTGDLGFLADGELFLTGRAKDVVILRGRNYAPHDIEQTLDGIAGLRRDAAVAVSYLPEGADQEELLLFVEHSYEADEACRNGLVAACRETVLGALALVVDRVTVLVPGTLPRTSSGKLRRGETLRRHLADALTATQPVATA